MNVETSKRSEEYKKNQPKMKGGNTSVKTVNGKKNPVSLDKKELWPVSLGAQARWGE